MSTRPYELLARFDSAGQVAGVSVRTITTLDGKDYEGDPQPLSGATDPAFASFAAAFSASVMAENEAIKTENESLKARIESLLAEVPYNPRIIDATAFYERITKDEFASLSVSDDPMLKNIAKTILTYRANDWPVVFESTDFQQLIGYMLSVQFLTEKRSAELTKDATSEEAYRAD